MGTMMNASQLALSRPCAQAEERILPASRPTRQDLIDKPWKYYGYRTFSQWTTSDNDLFVIRRFGSLNARVTLLLQDELSVLEERLDHLDSLHSRPDAGDIDNGTFRH